MIPVYQLEKSIPDLTGITVLIIAGCAFALSFFNLQAAALQAGINPWLSWMWPVCIDALLIAGSLMILRSSLRCESALVGWSVLISFTIISTTFNVIHSPADIVSRAAHSIPPVALCVSIELLMLCIRSDLQQSMDRTLHHENAHKKQVKRHKSYSVKPNALTDRIREHFIKYPDAGIAAAATELGVHRSTVSRHLKRISASGMLQEET